MANITTTNTHRFISSEIIFIVFTLLFIGCSPNHTCRRQISSIPELCKMDDRVDSHWASFENPKAQKGQGAIKNKGAKGYPYHVFKPCDTVTLLDTEGAGIIHRIWMTVDRLFGSPEEMRRMRIDMYWDSSERPAVSAPLADFFCLPLGQIVKFENELFSSPEAKSFVCYVPMPFRKGAKITLTNESSTVRHLVFYDIAFSRLESIDDKALYFHASWHRENPTTLGKDFEILPKVEGKGRYLGANISIITNKTYGGWWGEGEVKVYLDGDEEHSTLCGTGTEDYIGAGWGQGKFANRYQGSLVSDAENGMYGFYRLHVPDPVYFKKDCRVTLQQMGGTNKKGVAGMIERGLPVIPVSVIPDIESGRQVNLLDNENYKLDDYDDNAWTNYFRQDDVSALVYFYLDTPQNNLPALPSTEERIAGLKIPIPSEK